MSKHYPAIALGLLMLSILGMLAAAMILSEMDSPKCEWKDLGFAFNTEHYVCGDKVRGVRLMLK